MALLLLASGFIACVLPPTARAIAQGTSSADVRTAFSYDDMVSIADATRDYSFGRHDRDALLQTIYQANVDAAERASQAGCVLVEAPDLSGVDESDAVQVAQALSRANERFAYSSDALSHLDDCYHVALTAYIALAFAALAMIAGCVFVRDKRSIGRLLFGAGTVVLGAFAVLGAWAALDFDGLFTVFHELLFSQGNWTFPADSLLICALPTDFWVGMGAVWLAVSAIASILSMLIGCKLQAAR